MSEQRHEGVVRQDAALQAIVCEMRALELQVESMRIENTEAVIRCQDMPHNGESFKIASQEFDKLAKRLRTEI